MKNTWFPGGKSKAENAAGGSCRLFLPRADRYTRAAAFRPPTICQGLAASGKVFTLPSKIRQTSDILFVYSITRARETSLFHIRLLHGKQIKICSALWDGIPRRHPDSPTARGGTALYHKSAPSETGRAFCVQIQARRWQRKGLTPPQIQEMIEKIAKTAYNI